MKALIVAQVSAVFQVSVLEVLMAVDQVMESVMEVFENQTVAGLLTGRAIVEIVGILYPLH